MSADAPIAVARTELCPEFNQFLIGTGDVLGAAVELACQSDANPAHAVIGDNAVLFRLGAGIHKLDVSVEVWLDRPRTSPDEFFDSLETTITAVDVQLYLVSTTPSPRDLTVSLPTEGKLTLQAFVLDRRQQEDAEFGIEVSASRWLIRVW
ncbi:hypothetical protein SAMN05421837_112224 [Amycolatopsis pretoriensis]|uniref:Uncharacterized protein n=1 Tax=Amycolatopsis pretoriensis TaxID=218821 RepID=A0A1H5RHZ5_9PSEU|nr:hypothetical protein [Amycolatopsis pretoriensis]SEF37111.1 hypothetical protein SAMN05421837_112224 [Amycolatopsis pretoriensis]